MDVHDKATRSYNMSRVRASETKPERLVRAFLFLNGLRYRKNVRTLPGKPDVVLRKHNVVIFIHGCFWHGHSGCKYYVVPKTKTEWWQKKIETNKKNDTRNIATLKTLGWKVKVIWECQLRQKNKQKTLNNLLKLFPIADTCN